MTTVPELPHSPVSANPIWGLWCDGLNGFEELRKYIKSGNTFCSEVTTILQERADAENVYAKSLQKLSAKLTKSSNVCIGTLAEAWSLAATEMEAEAEIHRQFSQSLVEDLCKPMKTLADSQHKTRKPIELCVEKAQKNFHDKRADEAKCKKNTFALYKDREKICETLLNSRNAKGKMLTDKETAKLDKNVRKLEDSIRKSDKDYQESCLKAEACRQEWETCVYKASGQLQCLEEERISQMQDFLNRYNTHLSAMGPKQIKGCEKLREAVISVDCNSDLRRAVDHKGTGPNQPEQLLPEIYAEDFHNTMDATRRKQSLTNYLIYVQAELEKEVKGREGVEKLAEVYQNKPNYGDADAQAETWQRLAHPFNNTLYKVNASINFLEATRYKVACSLAELEGTNQPQFKHAPHIEKVRDKTGYNVCILRVPLSMTVDPNSVGARPPADGGHVESVYDDDEFDAYDAASAPICQATALYDYVAQHSDELTIHPGDVIQVMQKQADGWWQGELNGTVGIFPATYAEESARL
ncbi:hypothetical protein CAPTEDRAFT_222465 [Capitella teleta]|uniref:SH3 domain-containing protein n=1 Tax=Capitella teleta TaxID=283909 RepID=R7U6Q6_CAPTE|nr:hypothetical protein CAPTEDRAFT_222465 [Capitella teleta]|eukprot:ELU01831.1 hypothetical protein CAPTEDRAFT_222465 [Capitella teleta]